MKNNNNEPITSHMHVAVKIIILGELKYGAKAMYSKIRLDCVAMNANDISEESKTEGNIKLINVMDTEGQS